MKLSYTLAYLKLEQGELHNIFSKSRVHLRNIGIYKHLFTLFHYIVLKKSS